jgi:hypothetical protein
MAGKRFVDMHVIRDRMARKDQRMQREADRRAAQLAAALAAFRRRTGGAPVVEVAIVRDPDAAGPVEDVTLAVQEVQQKLPIDGEM